MTDIAKIILENKAHKERFKTLILHYTEVGRVYDTYHISCDFHAIPEPVIAAILRETPNFTELPHDGSTEHCWTTTTKFKRQY